MDSGTRQSMNFSFTLVKARLSPLTALPAFPHGTNSRASLAAEHEDLRDQQAEVSIKHQPQDTQQIAGFLLLVLPFFFVLGGLPHKFTTTELSSSLTTCQFFNSLPWFLPHCLAQVLMTLHSAHTLPDP